MHSFMRAFVKIQRHIITIYVRDDHCTSLLCRWRWRRNEGTSLALGTVYCEPVVLRSCLSAYSYTATTPDTYITNMNAKPNGGAFPKTACLAQSLRSQHNISLCTNTTNSIHYGNRCKS